MSTPLMRTWTFAPGTDGSASVSATTARAAAFSLVATASWGYLRLRRTGYDEAALDRWAERILGQPWREAYAFLKHDEEGTEAAAVTAVEVGVTSAPLPVVVDRPFVFAIREALSGTILFLGVMRNPAGS